jgi:hypothetical protein
MDRVRCSWLAPLVLAAGMLACGSDDDAPTPAAPLLDASPDVASIVQDAAVDASEEAQTDGDGGGCWPEPIDEWTPVWKPPKTPQPGLCSEQLVSDLAAACEAEPRDQARCNALTGDLANTACLDCLYSAATDSRYGAVVQYGHVVWANIAGCMALIDHDQSPTGCGPQVQAGQSCGPKACDTACVHHTGDEYGACAHLAYDTECKPYAGDLLCETKPIYGPCRQTYSSWAEGFAAFGRMFCVTGLGASDAGGDVDAGD